MPTPVAIAATTLINRTTERPTLAGTLASVVHYRELIRNLVLKDLKLKYRGSVLGFMWSLINPVVMIGVYAVAFTFILRTRVEGFVLFLLLGILPWGFFVSSANMATGAIIDNGSLMKSVAFPRAILPVAVVFFNLAQYLLTVMVLLPILLIAYRVPPSMPWLLYPVFLALQVLFTIGVALLLAAGTAFFRDVRHLLEIALSVLFWLTPIVYPVAQASPRVQALILLTPLSPFIIAYQQIFYYRTWPGLDVWAMGIGYALVTFTAGVWLFLSVDDSLAEHI
jgi:ABC-type polysaccharide/polyol phosphate export permease